MAVDQAILDDVAEKVAGGLRLIGGVKQEAQAQIKSILESAFSGLDVVSGERMQVAEAMLNKTREQMAELEARIEELEAKTKK
ncbi:MAG: 3-octaprenyl-4-hydroxybenzoate carboxy-lyase [Zetaproteobacteria bacterium CG12_big_fil_rev_8_21_14_0_65_55_1124]|nr:MAG: 3-octaprenyl-4-hydroxybenzoate carboxy-lyase [Zetaproteobacteria bacterium CG1_02_55_237]PIS20167.1 MAG: 3-octaprenyl-4-hydroxybenzoate carboxy-lyase [Zetaproteobacteria bacterium CG08_land_8_20_14_0_20_55_17]PIW42738.1 MAG: 3-octaprenyl-4-hydroxybenzoate carboxy-lyase [Zetaproteobacteria bacterium CG12_big_fil_rev_8_21_14_0_65_55_1124]PIY53751.1 MAG: 3-octaprenyl-4-hydroxybenzoate carboxy-lyase [Zetaproteobacteria bacterium CG_4_10_14_0_8_um_filter_55_43]PIZ38814.1 MAG: 3-octaprenyl-4-